MTDRTILVADDETHILHVLKIKLRNAGFRVIAASDGVQAYEYAVTERPDLIITDYQMPGLSGVELLTKLRCDPLFSGVPAVLLTARGFSVSEHDRRACCIERVIAKPFSPREVLACVEALLEVGTVMATV